jgi:hypothetical protein
LRSRLHPTAQQVSYLAGFGILNLGGHSQILKKVQLFVQVNNLLKRRYYTGGKLGSEKFRLAYPIAIEVLCSATCRASACPAQMAGRLLRRFFFRSLGIWNRVSPNRIYRDQEINPEEALIDGQTQKHILSVVQALAEQDRRYLLRKAKGLRYREIAEVVEISTGRVFTSLARSLARLARTGERLPIGLCAAVSAVLFFTRPLTRRHRQVRSRFVPSPEPATTPGAALLISGPSVCAEDRSNNREVPVALQRKVLEVYGLFGADAGLHEIDDPVTPASGGSDDIHNLWPHFAREYAKAEGTSQHHNQKLRETRLELTKSISKRKCQSPNMRDKFLILAFLGPFLTQLAFGCKCQMFLSSCDEVASSNVVFIGTVESIEPRFLSRWNLSNTSSLHSLNEAYLNAQQHPSKATLDHLREVYLKTFSDLPVDEKDRAAGAKTPLDVTSLFDTALDRGMRVRFHVRTLFKRQDGDDDDNVINDDEVESELDVWNPFGDCGSDFQPGETYLVYANREEASDYIFTSSCTRTRRLSDAGEDLSYLSFYKTDREQSARLEGFTTSDANSQADFDPLHVPQSLKSPVLNTLIELKSDVLVRYTEPDRNGRFIFDGLPKGEYQVSAFATGFPMYRQLLSIAKPLQIKEKSCAHQVLLIPANRAN